MGPTSVCAKDQHTEYREQLSSYSYIMLSKEKFARFLSRRV